MEHAPTSVQRPYCGSSPAQRRYGTARAPRTVRGHVRGHQCRSLTPMFIKALGGPKEACRRYCQMRLDLGDGAYNGIPVWQGAQQWVEIVVREAYAAEYKTIRPALVETTGGGISLKTLLAVATVMASVAEFDTGRESRLSLDKTIERTGKGERTVQRARQALKLLRVATEVFRGRLRKKKGEREGSYRVGDKGRGWASVWALHPRKPVDKTRVYVDGSIQMAPHPRRGHLLSLPSRREVLNTKRSVDKRAASRRKESKAEVEKAEGVRKGVLLASRWLGNPRTPAWARRHTPRGWALALTDPAVHGWTVADLNATIDAWSKATRIAPNPKHPIAFIRWLMKQQDIAFAPHVLAQIAADQEKAERERRAGAFEAERGRYASAAAEDSPGRQAARVVARRATDIARRRKLEITAAENAAQPIWITHRNE
ncbi:replication protein [Rhodococcus sp. APC 3903]|uniref:replication protein n=1 Tax=Rhodococcus sp. APC 3903 TaxID=3035193 RepID=UPI0025B522E3|nr:replication protein [Rhodococcus sp. APC 3903]MDN3460536.1 replication protein [Rhodococcus sp. APC 3903]